MTDAGGSLGALPGSLVAAQRDAARSRILRAARRALAERGLDTRVEDVAAAAGTSRRTVFRYFPTRDELLAAAVLDGIRSYREHIPRARPEVPVEEWLAEALVVLHRMNAHNGRGYWELALRPDVEGPLAEAAERRRQGRRELVEAFTKAAWDAAGGQGRPPRWLEDAFAIHLSAFATEALAGDFGRTPEEVGRVSARVLAAALEAALTTKKLATKRLATKEHTPLATEEHATKELATKEHAVVATRDQRAPTTKQRSTLS